MRPYRCTPQPLQAWRWIVAFGSTIFSLLPLALTLTLSRGATATCANSAPLGFQHLVQPQTWLCALCALTDTLTGLDVHRQLSVPPPKPGVPAFTPLSTAGWIEIAFATVCPPLWVNSTLRDCGKKSFRISAGESELVGMADSGFGFDLHKN